MKTLNVKWVELDLSIDTVCENCGAKGAVEVKVVKRDDKVVQESEAELEVDQFKNRLSEILHAADSGCGWKITKEGLSELLGR